MSTGEHCPTCGAPLSTHEPPTRLSRLQRVIYDRVARSRHGVSSDALFEACYADDPDGGPESGKKSMWVIIHALNKRLAPHGERVRSVVYYRLEKRSD